MSDSPSVLFVATQTWLQITRLAMRFAAYGCRLAVICPEECHLTYAPRISQRFRFRLTNPLKALHHAILTSGCDFIVPADDLSVWFLHELAEKAPELRSIIERSIGNPKHHREARSRFALLSLAHRLGITVPRTELISDIEDLHSWCAEDKAAFVLKKDGTWGGSGVQFVHSATEAHDAFQTLRTETGFGERMAQWLRNGDASAFVRLQCLSQPEITAQKLIQGVPANSMYACIQGKIVGEVQACVVASKGEKGPSLVIRLLNDPRITRAGVLLAEAFELNGFFGLDFMIDALTGEPYLIEMNPRSTQLGHISVANQPDLAGILWAQWADRPLPEAGDPSLGNAICFYPDGERWTRQSARLSGCRTDVQDNEEALLATLSAGNPDRRGRLRRRLWASLSELKGSLQTDLTPQPFYYQDLASTDRNLEAEAVQSGKVVSIAS